MKSSAHYEKGSESKITFVFSCPGRLEECEGKPAAGKTGDNLELFLDIIRTKLKRRDFARGKITITNASDKIYYKKENGRTEASNDEIFSSRNRNRLLKETEDTKEIIVCCGRKASLAIEKIKGSLLLKHPAIKIIEIRHLGYQSLNGIKLKSHEKSKTKGENTITRLMKEFNQSFYPQYSNEK